MNVHTHGTHTHQPCYSTSRAERKVKLPPPAASRRNGCHLPSRPLEDLENTRRALRNLKKKHAAMNTTTRAILPPVDLQPIRTHICFILQATHSPRGILIFPTQTWSPNAMPSLHHPSLKSSKEDLLHIRLHTRKEQSEAPSKHF